MEKSKINFVIDALMFLCMMAIAGLGFLMKFVLIPGKERWLKYGRNVELTLLGMDRHEWGRIHLIIGFVLLGALVLHIILHWKMILGLYQKLIVNAQARLIVGAIFVIVAMFLLLVPLSAKPQVEEIGQGAGRGLHAGSGHGTAAGALSVELLEGCGGCPQSAILEAQHAEAQKDEAGDHGTIGEVAEKEGGPAIQQAEQHGDHSGDIRGYMTLGEVAQKYGIPAEELKRRLGFPESVSSNERLGWLRKEHGFTMGDVEKAIEEYKASQ